MQMDGDDMMVAEGFKIGIQYPFVVGNWQTNLVYQKYHLDSKKCDNFKYEIVRTMKNNLAYLARFLTEQSEVEKSQYSVEAMP